MHFLQVLQFPFTCRTDECKAQTAKDLNWSKQRVTFWYIMLKLLLYHLNEKTTKKLIIH